MMKRRRSSKKTKKLEENIGTILSTLKPILTNKQFLAVAAQAAPFVLSRLAEKQRMKQEELLEKIQRERQKQMMMASAAGLGALGAAGLALRAWNLRRARKEQEKGQQMYDTIKAKTIQSLPFLPQIN